jgi:hypothetical protein
MSHQGAGLRLVEHVESSDLGHQAVPAQRLNLELVAGVVRSEVSSDDARGFITNRLGLNSR